MKEIKKITFKDVKDKFYTYGVNKIFKKNDQSYDIIDMIINAEENYICIKAEKNDLKPKYLFMLTPREDYYFNTFYRLDYGPSISVWNNNSQEYLITLNS